MRESAPLATAPPGSVRSHLDLAVLVLVNLLWAFQFKAIDFVTRAGMAPGATGFWTLLLAILFLLPFLLRERGKSGTAPPRSFAGAWPRFLLLGIFGTLPAAVLFPLGMERVSATHAGIATANASILTLAIPVLMAILGVVVLRERITPIRILSLAMALGGMIALSWADIRQGNFTGSGLLAGNAILLAACGGSAFYNVYCKFLLGTFSELQVLVGGYGMGALGCLAIALTVEHGQPFAPWHFPVSAWLSLAVLGGVVWGLSMVLFMWVLKRLAASQVAVSIYFLPMFGVMIAVLTGERPGGPQLIGGLFVILGTYLVSDYEARRPAASRRT